MQLLNTLWIVTHMKSNVFSEVMTCLQEDNQHSQLAKYSKIVLKSYVYIGEHSAGLWNVSATDSAP